MRDDAASRERSIVICSASMLRPAGGVEEEATLVERDGAADPDVPGRAG